MATITEIQNSVNALAVRVANEIDALRTEMGSVSGATPEWDTILSKPSVFPPDAHTQASSTITDFNDAVDARIALAGGGDTPDWASITGKPATFPPEAHTQASSTITDFDAAVDARIALAGAGDGNVVGPAGGVVDGELTLFNGTTGAAIKGSGAVISANGKSLVATDYAGMRALLTLVPGTDVQASSAKLTALAAQTWAADKLTYQTGAGSLDVTDLSATGRTIIGLSDFDALRGQLTLKENIILAIGDEDTVLTTGVRKRVFRMPYGMTGIEVRASLATAQTSGALVTVDINESGASIISTKITIDNGELTSTSAATSPFVSDATLADDAEITIDVDQVGDGTAKGLKVYLIGRRV